MRICYQNWSGGLGDSLLAQSIPELLVAQGHTVVIKDGFRNPDIRAMWLANPYVEDVVDESSTLNMNDDNRLAELCIEHESSVKGTEAFFGLPPTNEHPKIYMDMMSNPLFEGKTLIDYNAITAPFTKEQIEAYLQRLLKRKLLDLDNAIIIRPPGVELPFIPDILHDTQIYSIGNLQNYVNAIFTCSSFITVSSGSSLLASAIKEERCRQAGFKQPKVYCLIHSSIFNKKIWVMRNLDYYITGSKYHDYDDF